MSSSSVQNSPSSNGIWSQAKPYVTSPIVKSTVVASASIVPLMYFFMIKTARQTEEPILEMNLRKVIKQGFKAAPTIGLIVGPQLSLQPVLEKIMREALMKNPQNNEKVRFTPLASSFAIALLSTPALAVFNGQTMGYTIMKSLKSLSAKQTAAIVSRETSFLFALSISRPLSEAMKEVTGDNKATKIGSVFFGGMIGSIMGHPFDTALSVWQKEKNVNPKKLMAGSPMRALGLGLFAAFHNIGTELLK